MTSLVAQTVKGLPTMRETWVRSLVGEDLLEKEMATHSSILAWKIPWTEEPGWLLSMGSQRVGHSPVAYWTPTDLRASSFTVMYFCLFIPFMGFSRQERWSGLPFPSPVGHILSELSTMTHPSWVALHVMTHGFIELGKVVIHDSGLHSVFPLMDKMLVQVSWWERLAVEKTGSCSGGQGYAH